MERGKKHKADKMDRRIKILRPVKVRSGTGHEGRSYNTEETIWASLREGSPTEGVIMEKETMRQTYVWLIRYRLYINNEYLVEYEGNRYEIVGITEVQRKKFMEVKTILSI